MYGSERHRKPVAVIALAALFVTGACAPRAVDEEALPAPAGVPMTSANIAGIAESANTGEIQVSQLALERSRNAQVRQFAQRMITEHRHANQQVAMATQRLGVVSGQNSITQQLSTTTRETMEALRPRSGAAFDRAYIDNQVEMHQWTLTTLDRTLLPATRDRELRTVLERMREMVAAHLSQARQIQQTMAR